MTAPNTSLVLGWTCYAYNVVTGAIVAEIQMVKDPTFSRTLNSGGQIQVVCQVNAAGMPPITTLRSIVEGTRFGLALSWGTAPTGRIVNAGPIWTSQYKDKDQQLTITAGGQWSLLNSRLLFNSGYNPVTTLLTDPTADVVYNASLHDIARSMISDCLTRGALPIDLPAADSIGGNTRTYFGYDMATVGQRLLELTQVQSGPDVDFNPYFSNASTIRHQMLIGSPTLAPQTSLVWDYQTGLTMVDTDSNAANLCTSAWVRGNGTARALVYGYSTNNARILAGWPLLDYTDSSHTSTLDSPTLAAYATSDLALYQNPVELWTATVRADINPTVGSYTPGSFCVLNMVGHPWIPNGQYVQRILGLQQGQNAAEVQLILQAQQGSV